MNPIIYVSGLVKGLDQIPEFKDYAGFKEVPMSPASRDYLLEPGVMFELEPNACRGIQKVNVGGTVLITKDGCEELNRMASEMRVAD